MYTPAVFKSLSNFKGSGLWRGFSSSWLLSRWVRGSVHEQKRSIGRARAFPVELSTHQTMRHGCFRSLLVQRGRRTRDHLPSHFIRFWRHVAQARVLRGIFIVNMNYSGCAGRKLSEDMWYLVGLFVVTLARSFVPGTLESTDSGSVVACDLLWDMEAAERLAPLYHADFHINLHWWYLWVLFLTSRARRLRGGSATSHPSYMG